MLQQLVGITCVLCTCSSFLLGYGKGPLPRYTGGYNENTCARCHSDFGLNDGRQLGGVFHLEGVPERYEAGRKYPVTIVMAHPSQSRWGFQLSARFAVSGEQAGELKPLDTSTKTLEAEGIQYIEHTAEGTRNGKVDGPVKFYFEWIAPAHERQGVVFNAAGNAADGSEDPTGDYIYTAGSFTTSEEVRELTDTQDLPSSPPSEKKRTPRITTASTFLHIPAPVDLQARQWEIQIQHRFQQALADSEPGDAFGLDSRANINLLINYALTERISTGVSRARFDRVIAFTSTYEINTSDANHLKLAFFGGVTGDENFNRHYSPFFQLATAFDYQQIRLLATPTLVLNSRPDSFVDLRPDAINPDSNNTVSLGLGIDVALNNRISLSWEYVPRLAGFGGFGETNSTLSAAIKIRSWGHVFTVMASTSRAFTPERYAVNAEPGFSLGFNIYRRIR